MSIINRIKSFLLATAGTPVTPVNLSSSVSIPKKEKQISTKYLSKLNRISTVFRYMLRAIKFISRVFAGAILLIVLANFAPELREKMPSVYSIVDLLLIWLEWIFSKVWQIMKVF